MSAFLQDLRHAGRQLLRRPGMTLTAIVALALGIGATTAIFTAINAVLLQPLPFAEPERLVQLGGQGEPGARLPAALSGPAVLAIQSEATSFEGVAAMRGMQLNVTGAGDPERLLGAVVSANFFEVLRPQLVAGQVFSEALVAESGRLAVLSRDYWHRRHGARPEVIGSTITVGGEPVRVVGVISGEVRLPEETELWLSPRFKVPEHPLRPTVDPAGLPNSNYLDAIGRLRPGVSGAAADAELEALAERQLGELPPGGATSVIALEERMVGRVRPTLILLFGAVGLILLVACANVANLLLARALSRTHEVAVRIALGARRAQLIRMFFAESLVLSVAALALGLALAAWGAPALTQLASGLMSPDSLQLDGRVLLFSSAVSLVVACAFALVPALASEQVGASVREGVRTSTGGSGRVRARSLLVGTEVAISLVLLVGAGLLGRSFLKLQAVDPGFRAQGVAVGDAWLPQAQYPTRTEQAALFGAFVDRLEALPEVAAVGVVSRLPLSSGNSGRTVLLLGRAPGEGLQADYRLASGGYFDAVRIPLRAGRHFRDGEARVAIVNQAFAELAWPGASAIGQLLAVRTDGEPSEVVGVIGNILHTGLDAAPRPEIYLPLGEEPWPFMTVAARARSGEAAALVPALHRELRALDSQLPLADTMGFEARIAQRLDARRFAAGLVGVVAALALFLAITGIAGVTTYLVSLRSREVGIRLALGATPRGVLGLVLREGMTPVILGAGVGLVLALAGGTLLKGMLFGLGVADPVTFGGITAVLLGTAALACFLAGRRVTRVDPAITLRSE